MNLKKFMQEKAEEEYSSVLTEEEKEYCNRLEAETRAQSLRYNRKFWAFFSCAAAILIAAVIAISIIFSPHKPALKYQGEKKAVASNITDLNTDTKYFEVGSLQNTACQIMMNYDVDSGDKLYYEMFLDGLLENSKFYFVINKDYNFDFNKSTEAKQEPLTGYSLNYYSVKTESKEEGYFDCTYKGWIELKTETVYFTYTQSPELGDDVFFDYVRKVVKVK